MNSYAKLLLVGFLLTSLNQAEALEPPVETDAAFEQRMEWFNDAQFGLFIHYGVYSVLGGEWPKNPSPRYTEWIQSQAQITPEEYIPFAAQFRPDKLDADLWVKTAKEAGMKYMVITTKHHEGFCLWDSAFTEYDLGGANDFDRDILGELKAACDKYGLKFGTYYSITDWHHPSQRAARAIHGPVNSDKEAYVAYMKGQLKELIDRYDPAVMWFDGDWAKWWTLEDGMDLYGYLRELSPDLVINNRVAKRDEFKKDFGTPEQSVPRSALDYSWETCWTMNGSWGFKKSATHWNSIGSLIRMQIDVNTKGGNLLLNVGPQSDGAWPEQASTLLRQMGAWNGAHQDAVWGIEVVDAPKQSWGKLSKTKASTPEAGELFAYIFSWPKDGKLIVKGIKAEPFNVFTYDGEPLPEKATEREMFTYDEESQRPIKVMDYTLEIDLSSAKPTPHATVLRIAYQGLETLEPRPEIFILGDDDLMLEAGVAKLDGDTIAFRHYIGSWTDPAATASWMLNVPGPRKYTVKLYYSCEPSYSGSDVKLTVSGKTLTAKVPPTAGWDDFEMLELGELDLNQVGGTLLKIGFGDHKEKALFNLKAVLLTPR